MASFWKNLFDKLLPEREPLKEQQQKTERTVKPPVQIQQTWKGYPNTYQPEVKSTGSEKPEIFDPALRHYSRAFRNGDPKFENQEIGRKWKEARGQVVDHLLRLINTSKWHDSLVLRGSMLLKAWLGNEAREPGDIDWVFRPVSVGMKDSLAKKFFTELRQMVSNEPEAGNDVVIEVDNIAQDDIWTYERAEGKRLVFPWKSEGVPPGIVQMDIVFSERLWTEPVQTLIPTYPGSSQLVWSADKEISLAWKLLWLETDSYPQGKDLYDAVLLAEQTYLSLNLLKQVLESGDWYPQILKADFPLRWHVDWENFKLEYPWVRGEAREWQERLTNALTLTFATAEE